MPLLRLNSRTAAQIAQYRQSLPQALLLSGAVGSGLYTLARDLAGSHHQSTLVPVDRDGNPDPQKGSIQVAQIRNLYQHASVKATSPRVFIIDDAHRMTHSAQNAFLKLLEEPTEHTYFVLTSHDDTKLLPTIHSRVQRIDMRRVADKDCLELLAELGVGDTHTIQQMLFLARGLPAELTRLAASQEQFTANATIVADAKKLLQGTSYQRLAVVMSYSKERTDALKLLDYALAIISFTLSQHPSAELVAKAATLNIAYDRIVANGNIRLQLASAVV